MILPLSLPIHAVRVQAPTVVDNGRIRLTVDRSSGRYALAWGTAASVREVVGEARLEDGRLVRTDAATSHEVQTKPVRDAFGTGTRVTVRHRLPEGRELRQLFWIYRNRPETIVRLDLIDPKGRGTNYLAPVLSETPLTIRHRDVLRALFVPWDNDMYFRYRSDGWGEGEGDGDGSYEVGAVWDDTTREALVIGSVDHDLWKSAVRFKRIGNEVASVRAFAGVTSKYTHDSQPHGTVRGTTVSSPRMVVGWYGDWRDGLERYGDLNAIVRPPLAWTGPKPFAWNSWSGHKTKVNAEDARIATEFVAGEVPNFRSGGTAYVNLDSYWSNLNETQLKEFVSRAHAKGLKAGIYWTPFACWGGLDKPVFPGTTTTFREICLKDAKGNLLPQLDTAYPIDPTHPVTHARIDREMNRFVGWGFDYVKLDFLSHGAIEGVHHDPKVQTGTQAYTMGMKRIVSLLDRKRTKRPFFISLSIAPLFPHGFAHSRRISCDVFANIGASEYLMNSANYAWWEAGCLYRFNDPDSATVFQAMDESSTTEAEARTRFVASVVAGGMMILGDDLGKPEARARVLAHFRNEEALEVARRYSPFRPVNGDTDYAAGESFVRLANGGAYVAVFNYSKEKSVQKVLPLARLGLSQGTWVVRDIWTKTERKIESDLDFELPPMSCALVRLRRP